MYAVKCNISSGTHEYIALWLIGFQVEIILSKQQKQSAKQFNLSKVKKTAPEQVHQIMSNHLDYHIFDTYKFFISYP